MNLNFRRDLLHSLEEFLQGKVYILWMLGPQSSRFDKHKGSRRVCHVVVYTQVSSSICSLWAKCVRPTGLSLSKSWLYCAK